MYPLVAICFHLGYNNRFNEFTPYIDNVLQICPNADLYITYREDPDPSNMCLSKYPRAKFFKSVRGCDIGAFLRQIQAMIHSQKTYDYVFKLHTKSNNSVATNWIQELLDKIAGSPENVKRILRMFKHHKSIGLIGSERWVLKREISFRYFYNICKKGRINIDGHFIGGTIFWIRFPILKIVFSPPRFNIDFEYPLFELGKPSEPSYTHAWERVLGLMVETEGYRIKGV